MQFHRDTTTETNIITGYGAEGVRIGTEIFSQSCIVAPDRIIASWAASDVALLDSDQIECAAALQPELILLGTGARLCFPPAAAARGLMARGIGFEVMDTAAACRTYNVLVHEGRQVVAALIL